MSETTSRGLEGIVIADSSIGYIDGQQGVLRYRGVSIEELANHFVTHLTDIIADLDVEVGPEQLDHGQKACSPAVGNRGCLEHAPT